MGCRIHLSMKPIIRLYYGHSDFSPLLTMTLSWIPVKICDHKVARFWLTSVTLEFKKEKHGGCHVSNLANTNSRVSSSTRNILTAPLGLRVDFSRDSMFPSTKPTPFLFERKCYVVNLFLTIIQIFL